jgi:hypothetical protein
LLQLPVTFQALLFMPDSFCSYPNSSSITVNSAPVIEALHPLSIEIPPFRKTTGIRRKLSDRARELSEFSGR